jgi:hypothetical protein
MQCKGKACSVAHLAVLRGLHQHGWGGHARAHVGDGLRLGRARRHLGLHGCQLLGGHVARQLHLQQRSVQGLLLAAGWTSCAAHGSAELSQQLLVVRRQVLARAGHGAVLQAA